MVNIVLNKSHPGSWPALCRPWVQKDGPSPTCSSSKGAQEGTQEYQAQTYVHGLVFRTVIIEINTLNNIVHALGKGGATKSDEFSEKFLDYDGYNDHPDHDDHRFKIEQRCYLHLYD